MLLLRYIALLSGLDAQTTPTFSPGGGSIAGVQDRPELFEDKAHGWDGMQLS